MANIDNPIKHLFTDFQKEYSTWVLGCPIKQVQSINIEFPTQASRADMLFQIIDHQDRLIYLHLEFQRIHSHEPLPLRMLGYLTRIVQRDIGLPTPSQTPLLHSVVLYIGAGAGRNDTGSYQLQNVWGTTTLHWTYQVIRLWEIEAKSLLALSQPALTALIGLTHLQQPHEEIRTAIEQVRQVTDNTPKSRLLTALVGFLPQEEMIQMAEQMLEQYEELFIDTPFFRRIRKMGLQEGREEGFKQGIQKGIEQGIEQGAQQGMQMLRDSILAGVSYKFNPPPVIWLHFSKELAQIHNSATLQDVLGLLFQSNDMTSFMASVAELLHKPT